MRSTRRTLSNFYPRPPRGGRPNIPSAHLPNSHFYPRPPRGGRQRTGRFPCSRKRFLSTPSARRATPRSSGCCTSWTHFYPRPPRGGRQMVVLPASTPRIFLSTPSARRATTVATAADGPSIFLSTPSARRATTLDELTKRGFGISIHALREEGDGG